ncbi:MAG TPA: hypothetical protein EYN73_09975 [Chromatiaceae bacterium]|jgi:hypothetical protein|nr:hypothetical protein [Chromatiaceae bacterium]HIN82357.1 hypothetical protein [Chromatiales bacterium]HIA09372.1 hypothetical protein [Chromatiaceae bacterium]HIB84724.1 hypothetical protein [Chromatiaceae bacterium]HIO14300.1 hypothetical protein [Chromatiales bacterium]
MGIHVRTSRIVRAAVFALLGGASISAQAATILINEVDVDQAGIDSGEFVELYADGGVVSLEHYLLVFFNGSNEAVYQVIGLDGYATNESGFFTVGAGNIAGVDLSWADLGLGSTNRIQNGADAIGLIYQEAGDASIYTKGSPVADLGLVDVLVYGTDDADSPGLLALYGDTARALQVNENDQNEAELRSLSRFSMGVRDGYAFTALAPTPGQANMSVAAVPLPGALGLFLSGFSLILAKKRRLREPPAKIPI